MIPPGIEIVCLNCYTVFDARERQMLPSVLTEHRRAKCPECDMTVEAFAQDTGLPLLQLAFEAQDWAAVCPVCNRDVWQDENGSQRSDALHSRTRRQRAMLLIEHTQRAGVELGRYTRCPGSDQYIASSLISIKLPQERRQ